MTHIEKSNGFRSEEWSLKKLTLLVTYHKCSLNTQYVRLDFFSNSLLFRPFCAKLCNYCNFNKYVNKDEKVVHRLGKCLEKEGTFLINRAKIEKIDTIYFGGGTPSLMPTNTLCVSNELCKGHSSTTLANFWFFLPPTSSWLCTYL